MSIRTLILSAQLAAVMVAVGCGTEELQLADAGGDVDSGAQTDIGGDVDDGRDVDSGAQTDTGGDVDAGNDADSTPALRFDPATCEVEPSTTVLQTSELDTGLFTIDGLTVVRETGAFDSARDAALSFDAGGPELAPELEGSHGPLERWEQRPSDFGGIVWVDTRIAEIVFAGSVVWMGGGSAAPPAQTVVLTGGPPAAVPTYIHALNENWDEDDYPVAPSVFATAVRTEAVARYTACGDPTIVVYIYTPRVGLTDATVARGIVMVAGYRATTEAE